MDLIEKTENVARHPWEISRLNSLRQILKTEISFKNKLSLLDVGCGDGYIVSNIIPKKMIKYVDAIDINLTEKDIDDLNNQKKIRFHNKFSDLKTSNYDLILMLDVIEHVEDDKSFILSVVNHYLNATGLLLITVPAFSFLFSAHDKFLGHYRRYSRKELLKLLDKCNIKCKSSGYLFFSLTFFRFISWCIQKTKYSKKINTKGIGHWGNGAIITKIMEIIFNIENSLLIKFNKLGIKLPGLTVWVICKKQQL